MGEDQKMMKVVATIRRVVVSDVPVTLLVEDLSAAATEASLAARALQASETGSDAPAIQAQVLKIEDAASGATIFQNTGSSPIPEGFMQVIWRSLMPASSHEEAACLARIVQANPASPMSVFEVVDAKGNRQVIDLQQAGNTVH